MGSTALLLEQRSVGLLELRVEHDGIAVLREAGSAKCRMPRGTTEAIMINTSGGLAGGDHLSIRAEAGAGATLTMTSQTAERVYRTLGPDADVTVNLSAKAGATLLWMPQETILFEGSALRRKLTVELAAGASFLAVEQLIFGRRAMGETIEQISVNDHWTIKREGRIVHAEAFRLGPRWPISAASFGAHHATATLVFDAPQAETCLDRIRAILGPDDGASAWNGKLVARLLARDGFQLRKTLFHVVSACVGQNMLPKTWTI